MKHAAHHQDWISELLIWFHQEKREMPWRRNSTPYHRWISEIMLQQTRVETVIPYFNRFIHHYPDIATLSQAAEDDVLKMWQGLGYYSRARNLVKAAVMMMEKYEGLFPETEKRALSLPGVGSYTAAAVLSMAYGVPLPSVDGNVLRVYCRMTGLAENVLEAATVRRVRKALAEKIPVDRPGEFNEAMMELGALICQPTSPKCHSCPIREYCQALQHDQVALLPIRERKDRKTRHRFLVYVVTNEAGTALWALKNPPRGLLGGLWALPMIEMHEGVSRLDQTDVQEILSAGEEQAMRIWHTRIKRLTYRGCIRHAFTHRHWTMDVLTAVTENFIPDGFQWIRLDEIQDKAFPEAYLKVIRLMEDRPAAI